MLNIASLYNFSVKVKQGRKRKLKEIETERERERRQRYLKKIKGDIYRGITRYGNIYSFRGGYRGRGRQRDR